MSSTEPKNVQAWRFSLSNILDNKIVLEQYYPYDGTFKKIRPKDASNVSLTTGLFYSLDDNNFCILTWKDGRLLKILADYVNLNACNYDFAKGKWVLEVDHAEVTFPYDED